MGKKSPKPPDPQDQAEANRIDAITPFGSIVFSGPNRSVSTTTLSPNQQAILALQERAGIGLGQRAIGQVGTLPRGSVFSNLPTLNRGQMAGVSPDAFSRERANVEQATFQRAMSLLNPELQRSEEALQQRLANQGLPQASRAYNAETLRFNDAANRARQEAAWTAVQAGGAEQSRMRSDLLAGNQAAFGQALAQRQQLGQEQLQQRQIPMNEILAALGLSQVQMPQGFSPAPVQFAGQPGSPGIAPSLFTLGGAALGAFGGPLGALSGAQIGAGLGRGLFG